MSLVKVQRQFDIAQAGNDALENVLHGPYNKLLNTLFPVDNDLHGHPQLPEINSTNGADYLVTFENFSEIGLSLCCSSNGRRILVRSKRTAAADRLRGRLSDLIDACPLPVLHGVGAFGTKLRFYSLTKTALISPEYIPAFPQYVIDTSWPLEL